jgi:hypothetical protein
MDEKSLTMAGKIYCQISQGLNMKLLSPLMSRNII